MYELNPNWQKYYENLEPEERGRILEEIIACEEDDGANDFRRQLYKERYTDPKDEKRSVDNFLWKCVFLPGLYRKRRFLFGNVKKECVRTAEEMHLLELERLSEAEKNALYWEFRNAVGRYLMTCQGDRYGKRLFGMKSASKDQKQISACEDVWMMSRGIARTSGLENEMRIFCDAAHDELMSWFPQGEQVCKRMEENHK